MKILHICLCGPFTDNWSYQENILTKYHKKLGYDVSVIASKFIWSNSGEIAIDERDEYINDTGVKIIRIKSVNNTYINSKFKKYKDLYKSISNENPGIIFVHGIQFLDILSVIKYAKSHPEVKIYVDNHGDLSNSATNWLSKKVLHGLIWKYFAHLISPYTTKFYGVLPARVDFLKNIYRLPEEKIELLLMGADDDKVNEARNPNVRQEMRKKYNIEDDDFLIMTGGKIDNAKKQTLLLMEAVKRIDKKGVRLIVFGSVTKELKDEVNRLTDGDKVQYIGWVNSEDSYKYFAMADLVVFPGRHSVFWEQVAGLGIPMIVKFWEGTTHIDIGGNVLFLYDDSIDEIFKKINILLKDKIKYYNMKITAMEKGMQVFSYKEIAQRSITNN